MGGTESRRANDDPPDTLRQERNMPHPSSRKKRPAKTPKPHSIEVPNYHGTFTYDIGTVHVKLGHTDNEGTLGTCKFYTDRSIGVILNIAHPGIRSAALAHDQKMLNCYKAAVLYLGINETREKNGRLALAA